MLGWLTSRGASSAATDWRAIPGIEPGAWLTKAQQWALAGQYLATHQMIGSWRHRVCSVCGTRRCSYRRWADDLLSEQARRDWQVP
jgi:hypothetical protein